MSNHDRAGEFGQIYLPALDRIRNLWLDIEPLVENTYYNDIVSPTTLHIELADGLGTAASSRFEIQWSELAMYSFHYTDSENVNWRFDRHPNNHSTEKHFHPPRNGPSETAEPSCIKVEEVSLVTRAVHAMWRVAYDHTDLKLLNSTSNPS